LNSRDTPTLSLDDVIDSIVISVLSVDNGPFTRSFNSRQEFSVIITPNFIPPAAKGQEKTPWQLVAKNDIGTSLVGSEPW
jgi:hypothetical protein